MTTDRNELMRILSRSHARLTELTGELNDTQLDYCPTPEDWSIREILAHLVDDDMYVMRTRLERIVKENTPNLAPHDEKYWYAHRNKNRDQLTELLADFLTQRTASLGIMTMLRDEDWKREGYQPEIGTFTAEEWLAHWVQHDSTHIEQIKKTLKIYELQTP